MRSRPALHPHPLQGENKRDLDKSTPPLSPRAPAPPPPPPQARSRCLALPPVPLPTSHSALGVRPLHALLGGHLTSHRAIRIVWQHRMLRYPVRYGARPLARPPSPAPRAPSASLAPRTLSPPLPLEHCRLSCSPDAATSCNLGRAAPHTPPGVHGLRPRTVGAHARPPTPCMPRWAG